MKNKAFERKLRERLARAKAAVEAELAEATAAKERGDLKRYYGARDATPVGDYFWLVGETGCARKWYRLTANSTIRHTSGFQRIFPAFR